MFARYVRGQIIHRQRMRFFLAQPACTALFQPDIAADHIAFVDGHPAFKGELCRFQRNIVLHPFTEPRLQVNVISLKPDATIA